MEHNSELSLETAIAIMDIVEELDRARLSFPAATKTMCALTEEVGELAKALLDEDNGRVYEEAIQVAVMAIRVATEGDASLGR
jgi:NTP pyrophosphatase (non-canonical NTP hydrolase)